MKHQLLRLALAATLLLLLTQLLDAIDSGDPKAAGQLLPLV
jgi:hypothetical protein